MNNEIQEIIDLAAGQGIVLDPCLLRDYPLGTWFWAIHHQIIAEPLTEPLANRIKYILTQKDQSERAVRLKALRPVMKPDGWQAEYAKVRAEYDKAGAEYDKAWAEYNKARAECDKVRAECNKARAEYDKAWAEYDKAWAEYNKARAECDKELFTQWGEEYPDHPIWDKNGLAF
jgi:tetratricopeptide (TPR) repeat protein